MPNNLELPLHLYGHKPRDEHCKNLFEPRTEAK